MINYSRPSVLFKLLYRQILSNKVMSFSIFFSMFTILLYFNRQHKTLQKKLLIASESSFKGPRQRDSIGAVNWKFWGLFWRLIRRAYPSLLSKTSLFILSSVIANMTESYISVYSSVIKGQLAKALINRNSRGFIKNMALSILLMVPASTLTSFSDFARSSISLELRDNLTRYFQKDYFTSNRFYQMNAVDCRIRAADQRLTTDIRKFTNALTKLGYNTIEPLLEMLVFGKALSSQLGFGALSIIFFWYIFSGVLIKLMAPPTGLLKALIESLEGKYRSEIRNISINSETIAFQNGNAFHLKSLQQSFSDIHRKEKISCSKDFLMGILDEFIVEHGPSFVTYSILVAPIFSKNPQVGKLSSRARNFTRNSGLMVSFASAVGNILVSYKGFQKMSGLCYPLIEFERVLLQLSYGVGYRVSKQDSKGIEILERLTLRSEGKVEINPGIEKIELVNVPIVTPTDKVLIERLNLVIEARSFVLISGPFSAGKSSIFRTIIELWPLRGGLIVRPELSDILYLGESPYFTEGTLKEQIAYPSNGLSFLPENTEPLNRSFDHHQLTLSSRKITDFSTLKLPKYRKLSSCTDLLTFEDTSKKSANIPFLSELNENTSDFLFALETVGLSYLIEGSNPQKRLNSRTNWAQLSLCEQQQLSLARAIYSRPKFVFLDECTGSIPHQIETNFYQRCRELGISVVTASEKAHLETLHDLKLLIDQKGKCTLTSL